MTLVTESTSTEAEAPGYTAAMVTWGGATTGNCETGSDGIANRPASEMKMATTHAKLGRPMKNLDMIYPCEGMGCAG
ncbi:hypothetical protein G6F68_009797 [Rhizopus microsporus]|nr:hypothetical protein G6F68_009797 [Rhizopus microsporus]